MENNKSFPNKPIKRSKSTFAIPIELIDKDDSFEIVDLLTKRRPFSNYRMIKPYISNEKYCEDINIFINELKEFKDNLILISNLEIDKRQKLLCDEGLNSFIRQILIYEAKLRAFFEIARDEFGETSEFFREFNLIEELLTKLKKRNPLELPNDLIDESIPEDSLNKTPKNDIFRLRYHYYSSESQKIGNFKASIKEQININDNNHIKQRLSRLSIYKDSGILCATVIGAPIGILILIFNVLIDLIQRAAYKANAHKIKNKWESFMEERNSKSSMFYHTQYFYRVFYITKIFKDIFNAINYQPHVNEQDYDNYLNKGEKIKSFSRVKLFFETKNKKKQQKTFDAKLEKAIEQAEKDRNKFKPSAGESRIKWFINTQSF